MRPDATCSSGRSAVSPNAREEERSRSNHRPTIDSRVEHSSVPRSPTRSPPERSQGRSTRTCPWAICRSAARSCIASVPTGLNSIELVGDGLTYVEFSGRTAYGDSSNIPFHVTSADWQESDRLMAGILNAFGSSASAVPVAGYGEFDGVMTKSFARPRIEGAFDGYGLRAWNVRWDAAARRWRSKTVTRISPTA